jgi:hypothetical protein
MNRRRITAAKRAMLLAWGILLVMIGGCQDQLLPPTERPEGGGGEVEPLVFINDYGPGFDPVNAQLDLTATNVTAVRPDGAGRRVVMRGVIASSPRGGKIALLSNGASGNREEGIYIATIDGANDSLVVPSYDDTQYGINPYSVVLGPDAESLAWVTVNQNYMGELRVRSRGRTHIVPLQLSADEMEYTTSVPAFSPNGAWVAYSIENSGTLGSRVILVNTSSGVHRSIEIPLFPSIIAGMVAPPFDWSSDNQHLLFAGFVENDTIGIGSELMVIDINTQSIDTLTNDLSLKESPRWLPAGGICYVANIGRGADLFLRDATGEIHQLTFEESSLKIGLSISPDGRTALYSEFGTYDQLFSTIRTYDIAKRSLGPVLATQTDIAHWRR